MSYTWSEKKEDEFWDKGVFETVEDCVRDAKEGYNLEGSIAVGEVECFEVFIDADDVLERLEEQAYDECGEASEDWLATEGVNYKGVDELSKRLTDCVNNWLEETNQKPKFYKVRNIKVYYLD